MVFAERLALLLSHRPLGLITDLDGTISPIAPTPRQARVDPRCRRLLKGLLGLLELVAVLSGRPAAEARRMVGLPGRAIPLRGSPGPGGLGKKGVVYIGHHGLSRWDQGREEMLPGAEPFAALAAQARRELSHLETMPGLLLEDKAFGLSIHYRQAPSAAAARRAILAAVAASPAAQALSLHEGRRLVELRPPLADKGKALERLAAEYGLRGAIYLGDDLTDVDAFEALKGLRQGGKVAGLAVAVASPEAPPALLDGADLTVDGVEGVAALLAELAAALTASGRQRGQ